MKEACRSLGLECGYTAQDQTLRTVHFCSTCSRCERGKKVSSTPNRGKPGGTDITEHKGRTRASEELAVNVALVRLLTPTSPLILLGPAPGPGGCTLGVCRGTHLPAGSRASWTNRRHIRKLEWGAEALLPPCLWPGFLAVALNPQ